jgi:hypothetical protein
MDSQELRRNIFGPVTGAVSDSWLQIQARPSVFLLIWLTLSIAPLLILAVIFLNPLSDAVAGLMKLFEQIMTSGGDPSSLSGEYLQAFARYIGISFSLAGLLIVSSSFVGSVLFGAISRFRERATPSFEGSLRAGAARFIGFLISVLLTSFRIFLTYLAGSFLGSILGLVFNDLFYTPLIITGFFLFAALQRFGLAPFIHLSTEVGGRDAILISKAYYKTRRPVIAGLFLVAFLLPVTLSFLLFSLFVKLDIMDSAGRYVMGFILGFFQFLITIVVINFTMNNFPRDPGKDGMAEPAPID